MDHFIHWTQVWIVNELIYFKITYSQAQWPTVWLKFMTLELHRREYCQEYDSSVINYDRRAFTRLAPGPL